MNKSEQGKIGRPEKLELSDDDLNVEEFTEGEVGNFKPTFTMRIQEFLNKIDLEEREPVFYLYKYEDYKTGEQKSFIAKYRDCEPPDEDTIGCEHGSGRYLLCLNIPPTNQSKDNSSNDGKMRVYRFRVHARYDKIKRDRENSLLQPVQSPSQIINQIQPTGPNFSDAFAMIEKVFSMMAPILNRPKDESAQEVMRSSYGMINEIVKQNVSDSMKLIGDIQRNALMKGEPVEPVIEQENEPSLLEQFAPILNEWLPKLLGGGPQGKAVSQVVQMTPQFQQVMKDKVELNRIIKYLKETRGEKEAEQILSALGIKGRTTKKG